MIDEAQALRRISKALETGDLSPERRADLAFHLTDWLTDLEALYRLFTARRCDPARARDVLYRFLIHVPAHVAAAHRLLLDWPLEDVFEVGAVKGTGRPPPIKPKRRRRVKQA